MNDDPQHELDFDDIDLTGRTNYGGFWFEALAENSTLGNPIPIDREVMTGLLDGAFVVTDRHDNAEATFKIRVVGENSEYVKRGRAMLFQSCSRPVILGWRPPDAKADRQVYRVWTSHLSWAFDDLELLQNKPCEVHDLRLIRDPWAYSAEPIVTVVSEAAPPVPANATISDGTSTTGWTSPSGATAPATSAGKLRISPRSAGIEGTYVSETTKTLSATDFAATPFVTLEVKAETGMTLYPIAEGSAGVTFTPGYSKGGVTYPQTVNTDDGSLRGNPAAWAGAFVDDVPLELVTLTTLADDTVRYTWRCDDTSATRLRLVVGTRSLTATPPANKGFLLDNVVRSNVNPSTSTSGRAATRSLVVAGSARTAPRIAIEHPTSGLGQVIALSSSLLGAAGFGGPSIQPFLSGATLVPDTNAVSGSYVRAGDDLTPATVTYSVPTSQLPASSYQVLMRARSSRGTSTTRFLTLTVSQVEGSTEFGLKLMAGTLPLPASAFNSAGSLSAYTSFVDMGVITLPRQKAPAGSSAAVKFVVALGGAGGTAKTFDLDDVLLLPLNEGSAYTNVDCGSGAPALGTIHNRLWLDPETAFWTDPGVYVGTLADRANAFCPGHPAIVAWGDHSLQPGLNRLYVVTTGARNPTITATTPSAWY